MKKFGSWWESKEADFFINRNGITKEEAEEILPQIIKNLNLRKNRKSAMMLVDSQGVKFYILVWRNRSAELPTTDQNIIKTNNWEELPKKYQDLGEY